MNQALPPRGPASAGPVSPGLGAARSFRHLEILLIALAVCSGCLAASAEEIQPQARAAAQTAGDPSTNLLISLPKTGTAQVTSSMTANPLDSTNVLRSFLARGVVRELPEGGQTVIIKHDDIPGFMPRMTMEFNVKDTSELRGLKKGDAVFFRVKANQTDSWVESIQLAGTNALAQVPTDPSSVSLLNIGKLKPGEALPDAELLSEKGVPIHLSDFRGKALAFTFIFTRCPLPDFCPRMNQDFARARELLAQKSSGPTNWQFLSISFDPDFDKPGILTRYAFSYRGQNQDRWLFASAPSDVVTSMGSELDFRFANEGGSFVHNLRTVVIDTQGKLVRQFEGNRWKAADLADAMALAAQPATP